ncbi:MAG: DUF1919 domain-containing protein [Lachnospiraceae bacterium]|nr:DUF1919 domain-containing protein [Lachnospiraceae bacterium]
MKYKIVILLIGKLYEKYLNAIKFEEMKGNVEVIGVGDIAPYSPTLDGWRLYDTDTALSLDFDYLIMSQTIKETANAAKTLSKIGIEEDRVLSIEIFGSICFDFASYIKLHHSKVSIIAQNCWGGHTYHALKMQFLSPTINLRIEEKDWFALLNNLKGYMQLPLEEDLSEHPAEYKYPFGKLGDLTLHLVHYNSFDDARRCWENRVKRINWDNLFIMMYTTKRESAELFDQMDFERKVIFTPERFGLQSEICLQDFNAWIDDINVDFWKSIRGVSEGALQYYDPIKLLNGEEDYYRIDRE